MNDDAIARLTGRLPTAPRVRPTAGAPDFVVLVPIVRSDGDYHLLYEKRASSIRQGGEISFPGGKVEAEDVSLEGAAVRETVEELGVEQESLAILGRLDALVTHWGGIIQPVVGTLSEQGLAAARPNPDEVERTFLVSFGRLKASPPERFNLRVEVQPEYEDESGRRHVLFPAKELGLPSRYWKPWAGPPHPVYVFRAEGETIWGITAEITRRFLELLD